MSDSVYPNNQPVVYLDCDDAFQSLDQRQKLYAHYLSRASWYGGLIVLYQTSIESPIIFLLLQRLYSVRPIPDLRTLAQEKCGFTQDDFQALLVYSCGFFFNMGNYKGFGDSKFVPGLAKSKLEILVEELSDPQLKELWEKCQDSLFSLEDNVRMLGFPEKGITTYFSKNCSQKDSELVNLFFKEKNWEAYNTRLFKLSPQEYEVRLAGIKEDDSGEAAPIKEEFRLTAVPDVRFHITRNDFSPLLSRVNHQLTLAKEYAANDNQRSMLDLYIKSFQTGELDCHKDGSRYWIKDKSPVVESYIGFIETYRDPSGLRGEFEGFVAVVNPTMSRKFSALVAMAESFLPLLPWPPAFEKDTFLRPDFTSLDILTYAGSGIPSGICIPNYDDVRQNEGFKNVSLGNVIPLSYQDTTPNFLSPQDQALFKTYVVPAYELQVGLHELLGHGSGKLFHCNSDGSLNFDSELLTNPLTGDKIKSYYETGETYDSVFVSLGSSYEECRADCVGLYLCPNPLITKIFEFEGPEAEHVVYINWLTVIHYGVEGLQNYSPDTDTWLQAHSQASYVILQVLLEAGQGLVSLQAVLGPDGRPDLLLTLDREKILPVGCPALGTFLKKLQVYKSTADVASAREMYEAYSQVSPAFLQYRTVVMERKKPRKIFIQANTNVKDGSVLLEPYPSTLEGMIKSWIKRFQEEDTLALDMISLWKKDLPHFTSTAPQQPIG